MLSYYLRISKSKESAFVHSLNELGFPVFLPEDKRTDESNIIFYAYNNRNCESHECQSLSLRKMYDMLAKSMAAYLIVVNNVLPKLIEGMKNVPYESKIKLLPNNLPAFYLDAFDIRYNYPLFLNINDYYSHYHEIKMNGPSQHFSSCYKYSEDGWPVQYIDIDEENNRTSKYYYERDNNQRPTKCIGKENDDLDQSHYTKYSYDDENRLIQVEKYFKWHKNNSFELRKIIYLNYLPNGHLEIKHISRNWMHGAVRKPDDPEYTDRVDMVTKYDEYGFLIVHHTAFEKANYIYDENKRLTRINYSNNCYAEIKNMGEGVQFIYKTTPDDKGFVKEERQYKNGKLINVVFYKRKSKQPNSPEPPELSKIIELEYY